jgi:type VI secretion system protein ImpE
MTAHELYLQGNLTEAINTLSSEIKQKPTDIQKRTFLFELLVFKGEYARACKQLDIIAHYQPSSQLVLYSMNISAELARLDVFNGQSEPELFTDPPEFIEYYLKSIREYNNGNYDNVSVLLDQAYNKSVYRSWNIVNENTSVEYIVDTNILINNILEVFVNDKYFWIPFQHIKCLKVHQPTLLRDLIWTVADIECDEDYSSVPNRVFLPVLYCNSSLSIDDNVKLGRVTEWNEASASILVPKGRKTYSADQNDYSIFELQIERIS